MVFRLQRYEVFPNWPNFGILFAALQLEIGLKRKGGMYYGIY
jgi:hypothetical protein